MTVCACVKRDTPLTSACLQPRDDIIDPVLNGIGPKRTGGAQVELDVVRAACGVGVGGHGLSLAHVRVPRRLRAEIEGCKPLCSGAFLAGGLGAGGDWWSQAFGF